jgi:methionine-rich copper-binding protein CopC
MMVIRRMLTALFAFGLVASWAAPAGAHGILQSAEPAPDSTAKHVPHEIVTELTEAPVQDGRFVVKDGCDRTVNDGFEVDGETITAAVADAQPGPWTVRFDFISKVDGHRYAQSYSFKVAGKKDCKADELAGGDSDDAADDDAGTATADDDHSDGGDHAGGPTDAGEPASDEGSFPIVPVALGSVALVGVALLARRSVRG